jgi:ABC-type glycerol-3-phosphate transport system permease component
MAHYYQTMPAELEEAARTDGLTGRATFWRILLPLSGPGLAVVGVNGFLTTWNAFLHPLVLTTSEAMRTLPVGLASSRSRSSVDWGASRRLDRRDAPRRDRVPPLPASDRGGALAGTGR